MVDRLSPLAMKLAHHHKNEEQVGLVLGERSITNLWQIAGWGDFDNAAQNVMQAMNFVGIGDFHHIRRSGPHTAWRIAPDKLLIENAGDLSAHMAENLVVLDLSHARTAITLDGPNARGLLTQLIEIDVAPRSFDKGYFAQTGIHHVHVLIQCLARYSFEIIVPITWVETIWDIICVNAAPYGYNIRSVKM